MRRFHSYGPIDIENHYYATRKELIERTYTQLMGENPRKGGHYITVWAPRQLLPEKSGKAWEKNSLESITRTNSRRYLIKTY